MLNVPEISLDSLSLPYLAKPKPSQRQVLISLARLSMRVVATEAQKIQTIDCLVEMRADGCGGMVFVPFVLVRRPWRLDPAQGDVPVWLVRRSIREEFPLKLKPYTRARLQYLKDKSY